MAKFKTLLEPFGEIWLWYTSPFTALPGESAKTRIRALLQGMSDDELRALRRAARYPSRTNCWWAIYEVAPVVREEATRILEARRRGQSDLATSGVRSEA
ncbi:MAG: hypothetical protein AB1563_00190 [Bacillota bacterium]